MEKSENTELQLQLVEDEPMSLSEEIRLDQLRNDSAQYFYELLNGE